MDSSSVSSLQSVLISIVIMEELLWFPFKLKNQHPPQLNFLIKILNHKAVKGLIGRQENSSLTQKSHLIYRHSPSSQMKFVIWNVRVINCAIKQFRIKKWCSKFDPVCLVENKLNNDHIDKVLQYMLPSWPYIHNNMDTCKCRILICWNPYINITLLTSKEQLWYQNGC